MRLRSLVVAVAVVMSVGAELAPHVLAARQAPPQQSAESPAIVLGDAQRLFYTGRYEEAAALALELRSADATNLAEYELRSSALHFQIRRAMGEADKDRDKVFKQCASCADLLIAFRADVDKGKLLARERLKLNPQDEDARFYLGKLNLNYVWLQLGTLGHKTGWDEYWEARHSLDAVLKKNPNHVRGRVARAWIEYIVDTKMPFGTGWLLGGGSKKKALKMVREASLTTADYYDQTEASFALWDMQVREKNFKDAVVVARGIAKEFPGNQDVARFLEKHDPGFKVATLRR